MQAIYGENKEHAMGIGTMKMSIADVIEKNKGMAISTAHFLDDGLWRLRGPGGVLREKIE